MKIPFTKMQGAGNDYIYVNCFDVKIDDPAALSVAMSPRHFSVGADGLVLICPSDVADAKMRMFNADGSEGNMCGNAIRCVGKYLYDNGITKKTSLKIETKSGIKSLELYVTDGKVTSVRVDMGFAVTESAKIPVLRDAPMIAEKMTVAGGEYAMTAVSMGNPHAVTFVPEVESLRLEEIGPVFEHLSIFPDRVNTEFVRVIDPTTLQMRVWERGSGETFACGTGACATVAAAVLCGISPVNEEVTVRLRGGDLIIRCTDAMRVYMTGPAKTIYEGVYDYEDPNQ